MLIQEQIKEFVITLENSGATKSSLKNSVSVI